MRTRSNPVMRRTWRAASVMTSSACGTCSASKGAHLRVEVVERLGFAGVALQLDDERAVRAMRKDGVLARGEAHRANRRGAALAGKLAELREERADSVEHLPQRTADRALPGGTQEGAGIGAELADLQRLRGQHEQDPVRLNAAGDMDRLALACRQIDV